MKDLRTIITEKIKVSKNMNKDTTLIPNYISKADENTFKRVFTSLQKLMKQRGVTHYGDTDPYEDMSEWENYIRKELPKELQTKEKIWAFISCSLGYDYMFDDDDMERFDQGYLSIDWEDSDVITELAYRALTDLTEN